MPDTDIAVTKEKVSNHEERLKRVEHNQAETKELLVRMDQRQEELFHITKEMHDNGGTPRCYERAEQIKNLNIRLKKVEYICDDCNIKDLTSDHDNLKKILKWILGGITTVLTFVLARILYGIL